MSLGWGSSDIVSFSLPAAACGLLKYLSLSASHCDVHETAGVSDSLLRATLGGLLFLLGLDLRQMC